MDKQIGTDINKDLRIMVREYIEGSDYFTILIEYELMIKEVFSHFFFFVYKIS